VIFRFKRRITESVIPVGCGDQLIVAVRKLSFHPVFLIFIHFQFMRDGKWKYQRAPLYRFQIMGTIFQYWINVKLHDNLTVISCTECKAEIAGRICRHAVNGKIFCKGRNTGYECERILCVDGIDNVVLEGIIEYLNKISVLIWQLKKVAAESYRELKK